MIIGVLVFFILFIVGIVSADMFLNLLIKIIMWYDKTH